MLRERRKRDNQRSMKLRIHLSGLTIAAEWFSFTKLNKLLWWLLCQLMEEWFYGLQNNGSRLDTLTLMDSLLQQISIISIMYLQWLGRMEQFNSIAFTHFKTHLFSKSLDWRRDRLSIKFFLVHLGKNWLFFLKVKKEFIIFWLHSLCHLKY